MFVDLGRFIVISSTQFHTLLRFPAKEWNHAASDEWIELCEELRGYEWKLSPQPFPLSRKWELVSALQKVIRRGDQPLALQLIAKIEGMRPQEHAYFWRRLSVIACEDVGAGQEVLTLFVVACSQIFTPVQSKAILFDVFGFLVERLCTATRRSRTACTVVSIGEMLSADGSRTTLNQADREILCVIENHARQFDTPDTPFQAWQKRNDWRTAGLLKFLNLALPFPHTLVSCNPPPSAQLHDLPSYSYDMYTRSGREVLRRLIAGGQAAREISAILNAPDARDPLTAVGEALFFVEGGYVKGEVEYADLAAFHHRVFAARFGLSESGWSALRIAMNRIVVDGTIDEMRDRELGIRYAQTTLFLA